jgi:hypothetical protein
MVLWALVFGMSLTLAGTGRHDMGAQVEGVFKTESECKAIKDKLDTGSTDAITKGEVDPQINSFGAVCIPVNLNIHNKKKRVEA